MTRDPITELRRYAESLTREVDPGEARQAVAAAMGRTPAHRPQWLRRIATSTAALTALLGANLGLAVASDGSVPGDLLYGTDRFYDDVAQRAGLKSRSDVARERLQEASVLTGRGEIATALRLTQEALGNISATSSPEAVVAIAQAEGELRRAEEQASRLVAAPDYEVPEEILLGAEGLLGLLRQVIEPLEEPSDPRESVRQLIERAKSFADTMAAEADRFGPEGEGPDGEGRPGPPDGVPGGPPDDVPAGPPIDLPRP